MLSSFSRISLYHHNVNVPGVVTLWAPNFGLDLIARGFRDKKQGRKGMESLIVARGAAMVLADWKKPLSDKTLGLHDGLKTILEMHDVRFADKVPSLRIGTGTLLQFLHFLDPVFEIVREQHLALHR